MLAATTTSFGFFVPKCGTEMGIYGINVYLIDLWIEEDDTLCRYINYKLNIFTAK